MARHYLGMDVGGTKTYCLIADGSGRVEGFGRGGCGNYEYHGVDHAAGENRKALEAALGASGLSLADISAVGLGVAGADLPEDFDMLEREIYTPLFGDLPRVFKNDSMAALRGGTRQRHGIVIVCGTGSVCAGRNARGRETRVGGLGPEFGDLCTGQLIGEEGLRAIWQARDGITEPTTLTGAFVRKAGCADVEELFQEVYHGRIGRADLEPMAKLVFEASVDGDRAACAILERGGRYLAAMVNAAARRLEMTEEAFEVVMAGRIFKGEGPTLVDAMRAGIRERCSGAKCILPAFEPVVGALLMGYDLDQALTDEVFEALSGGLLESEAQYGIKLKA